MINCLVVWNIGTMELYEFQSIENVMIPTDFRIFFRGIQTTNQMIYNVCIYDIQYVYLPTDIN